MTLDEFNKRYIYVSDRDKFGVSDVWEVLEPNKYGLYEGDCESYALTIRKLVPEFSDWELYYCKLSGNGHCVLVKDGYIIDCNIKRPVSLTEYHSYFNTTDYIKYGWFVVFSKLLYTRLVKMKRKIDGFFRSDIK